MPEELLELQKASPKENPRYIQEQIITCIGNKRALLPYIGKTVFKVERALGKKKLDFADLFSGSGIVARFMKKSSRLLIANDLEAYSEVTNECYLSNPSQVNLQDLLDALNLLLKALETPDKDGFILDLYAPRDEIHITKEDRVFYTRRNAAYLDTARRIIGTLPETIQPLLLGPLLAEASIHVNTSGVFKGFYKNATGIGQFGGHARNALQRITGAIEVGLPVLSSFECEYRVYRQDANQLARTLPELDLVYIDPPYNQHPYGSNYFLLNLLVNYHRPERVSRVSGIPAGWNRSRYNKKREASDALFELIEAVPAKYCLISYNSEGFVAQQEFLERLGRLGTFSVCAFPYNTFRGSRNLRERAVHVTEFLYLLKK